MTSCFASSASFEAMLPRVCFQDSIQEHPVIYWIGSPKPYSAHGKKEDRRERRGRQGRVSGVDSPKYQLK